LVLSQRSLLRLQQVGALCIKLRLSLLLRHAASALQCCNVLRSSLLRLRTKARQEASIARLSCAKLLSCLSLLLPYLTVLTRHSRSHVHASLPRHLTCGCVLLSIAR
jgi:hypothetical protein